MPRDVYNARQQQSLMPDATKVSRAAEHGFYLAMGVLFAAAVLLGFARSYFLHPWFPDFPAPPEPFFRVHGAVFTTWFVLLIVQPLLVATGRTSWHRHLGRFGALVALGVVVSGVYGALLAAGREGGFLGVPAPPLEFLAIPMFDMATFGAFVLLGLLTVRRLQAHKRWMLLATVCLLAAAVARWPGDVLSYGVFALFGLQDAFVLPLVVWDLRSRGRLHPVTVTGGLLLIASQPLRLMIGGTVVWQDTMRWLIDIVR